MIYSKVNQFHHIYFKKNKFKSLDEWNPDDKNSIFYHHAYHDLHNQVPIYDCLNEPHWKFLQDNKDAIILHENCGETFNFKFIYDLAKLFDLRKINPAQVYIIVMDNVHRNFLKKWLTDLGINGVNIFVYNHLLNHVTIENNLDESFVKKFSMLSRNYRPWRTQLYCSLLKENLLDEFLYSFYNIQPYEKRVYDVDSIIADLKNLNVTEIDSTITNWLKLIPYELPSNNVFNKWSNITYQAITSSDIHVVIETHYDPFLNNNNGFYDRNYSPSSITEKTYKPMACKRPFIVFSTPYFLEDLRSLGYKTFSKFINEEYDLEIDNQKRLNLIIKEIKRINSLPPNEYNQLILNLKEICNYNLHHLIEEQTLSLPFFLKDYIDA